LILKAAGIAHFVLDFIAGRELVGLLRGNQRSEWSQHANEVARERRFFDFFFRLGRTEQLNMQGLDEGAARVART
jgi:hypothetical protein